MSRPAARSCLDALPEQPRPHAVALDAADPVAAVRAQAPDGVDLVVEVAFSDNVDLDAAVVRNGAVVAAYATRTDRPSFDFWPMLFADVTIRLLGSDDFPGGGRAAGSGRLTARAPDGDLVIRVADPFPLGDAARAHGRVDADNRRRVPLDVSGGQPDPAASEGRRDEADGLGDDAVHRLTGRRWTGTCVASDPTPGGAQAVRRRHSGDG